jgi:hypothetical protein
LPKKTVTEFAGRGFDADSRLFGVLGNISRSGMKLELMFTGQARNKFGIRIGFARPQLVIDVYDRKNNAEFFADLEQQAQQGNGIGAAGDGHTHPVAGVEQVVAADTIQNSLR